MKPEILIERIKELLNNQNVSVNKYHSLLNMSILR